MLAQGQPGVSMQSWVPATPCLRSPKRCLTLRSSGPPPARRLGREAFMLIIRLAAKPPRRWRPLSSNVRPHKSMKDFIAFLAVAVLVFPFLYYWMNSKRAKEGLAELHQQGFSPDVTCSFLSHGYKVAFDTTNRKVGFINVEFSTRSRIPRDGRSFATHRLSQVLDYAALSDVSIHRSREDGSLSKSGFIYIEFAGESKGDTYSLASMPFTHHDRDAIAAFEANWPSARRVHP